MIPRALESVLREQHARESPRAKDAVVRPWPCRKTTLPRRHRVRVAAGHHLRRRVPGAAQLLEVTAALDTMEGEPAADDLGDVTRAVEMLDEGGDP